MVSHTWRVGAALVIGGKKQVGSQNKAKTVQEMMPGALIGI